MAPNSDQKSQIALRRVGRPAGTNSAAAVLRAAKQLFLQDGFDRVNLERVGETAGLTRQTVYNLFGSKEALFLAVVEQHWTTVTRDVDAVLAASRIGFHDVDTVLRQFGEAVVRFVKETEQIAFTRLVIAESQTRPWIAQDFYRLGKQPLLEGLVDCLRQLDRAGLIKCGHPLIAANQFFGMIQEMVIWPHVMAIGTATDTLPPADLVISEALQTFRARYGRRSSDAAT